MLRQTLGTKARPRRRAVVAVQVAVFSTVLVACCALALDVGALFNAKAELQRTADAAALAAASQLANYETNDPIGLARLVAAEFAFKNSVASTGMTLDPSADITFGKATYNSATGKYDFEPSETLPDTVRVRVRKTADSNNGPVRFFFAPIFGEESTDIQTEAMATMVPRDIAIVADLSASHTDDSELGQVNNTQINLVDVWGALPIEKGNNGVGNGTDPPPPGNPNTVNDQPGSGPGSPNNQGGNPDPGADPFAPALPTGPRWGWMTAWGNETTMGSYTPVGDPGLYYIPKGSTTTDADVIANLIESGYSDAERSALLSGQYDSNVTYYRNRVNVLLGLAGWRSKKTGSKYNGGPGNGDNRIDTNELWQQASYPFDNGTWNDYIDYVRNTSRMTSAISSFRYRYGIKTITNYLLEKQPRHQDTPELAECPVQPMQAVKEAVARLADLLYELETDDQLSLEVYDRLGRHEVDLTKEYSLVGGRLLNMQAGYYDIYTNIAGGLDQAIYTLTNTGGRPDLARGASKKVILLLTDGNPNVDPDDTDDTNATEAAIAAARDRAAQAAELGIRIYTISVGVSSNQTLMQEISELGGTSDPGADDGEYRGHFHAEGAIDEYSDQLEQIFIQLGGTRPVELIQ